MTRSAQKVALGALIAAALAGVAWKVTTSRRPDPERREELEELARRVAAAEPGMGRAGTSELGKALSRLRYGKLDTRYLAVRINALAGDARMDPEVLGQLRETLEAIQHSTGERESLP